MLVAFGRPPPRKFSVGWLPWFAHRSWPGRNNKLRAAVGSRLPISSSCRLKDRRAKEVQHMATEEAIEVQFTAQIRKSSAGAGEGSAVDKRADKMPIHLRIDSDQGIGYGGRRRRVAAAQQRN